VYFRDANIHVEFNLPVDGDGNSGIYLQGLYELQILSAAGRSEIGLGDAGAIYGLHSPSIHAARGPNEWQSYDIRFIAPRFGPNGCLVETGTISAWLNGQLIHDRAAIGNKTSDYNPYHYDVTEFVAEIAERQRITSVGPLILQDHDSRVRFRNIWLVPLDDCAFVTGESSSGRAGADSSISGNRRNKDLVPCGGSDANRPDIGHPTSIRREDAGLRSRCRRGLCLRCQPD
jgi:hypothetical protein